jgi:hypothetical protein
VGYLQISDESVAEVRRDHVGEGEAGGEDPLCEDDACPEERAGPPQLQEGHQVHPLILCLLQQRVDPALPGRPLPNTPNQ